MTSSQARIEGVHQAGIRLLRLQAIGKELFEAGRLSAGAVQLAIVTEKNAFLDEETKAEIIKNFGPESSEKRANELLAEFLALVTCVKIDPDLCAPPVTP